MNVTPNFKSPLDSWAKLPENQAYLHEIDQQVSKYARQLYSLKGIAKSTKSQDLNLRIKDFAESCQNLKQLFQKIDQLPTSEMISESLILKTARELVEEASKIGGEKWLSSPKPSIFPEGILPAETLLGQTDEKLLLHIHGDSFGEGSGLEGEDMDKVLSYGMKFIESCLKVNLTALKPESEKEDKEDIGRYQEILRLGKEASYISNKFLNSSSFDFDDFDLDLLDKSTKKTDIFSAFGKHIKETLDREGSILISGGWNGVPAGHAMYYKVNKQENGKYTFYVFNRGAGLGYQGSPTETSQKLLYPACMEIIDIEEKDLLNPRFLQGMIDLRTRPKDINGSQVDVYEGLLPLLGGKVNKLDLELEDMMGAQHSGTCAWKSFCAFVRSILTYDQYKLFKYRVKQQSLWDYYHRYSKNLMTDLAKRNLFEKSMASFARSLEKVGEGGLISRDEYQQAVIRLMELQNDLAAMKIRQLEKMKADAPSVAVDPTGAALWESDSNYRRKGLATLNPLSIKKSLPSNKLTEAVASTALDPADLVSILAEMKTLFSAAMKEENYEDICTAFQLLMAKFPIPEIPPKSDFWKNIQRLSPKDTIALIDALSEIHDCFFKSTHLLENPDNRDPQAFVAIYKALALQDAFVAFADEEKIGMKGIGSLDFNPLSDLLGMPLRVQRALPQFKWDEISGSLRDDLYSVDSDRHITFPLRDPRAKEELFALHNYFSMRAKSISSSKPLAFAYAIESKVGVLTIFTESSAAESYQAKSLSPEMIYIKQLLKNKDFLNRVKNKIPNFDSLVLHEQIGAVYALEDPDILPLSFLQVRKQVWQMQYWMSYPLKKEAPINDPSSQLKVGCKVESQKTQTLFSTMTEGHTKITLTCPLKSFSIDYGNELHEQSNRPVYSQDIYDCIRRLAGEEVTDLHLDVKDIEGTQNSLLTEISSGKGYLEPKLKQNTKELLLLTTTPEVQLVETLAYMKKHSEYLEHPTFQSYFSMLLFEKDYMIKELYRNPEFANQLVSFIRKEYANYFERGHLGVCTFLLELNHDLQKHWNYVCQKNPKLADIVKPDFLISFIEIERLENIGSLSNIDKSMIYGLYIFLCSELDEIADMQKILVGISHLDRHHVPIHWKNPRINREISRILQKLSANIESLSEKDRNAILDAIVLHHYPHLQKKIQWVQAEGCIFADQDQSCKIDLSTGRLFMQGQPPSALPREIVESEEYKELFNKEYQGIALDLDTFEIIDDLGQKNRLQYNNVKKMSNSLKGRLQVAREIDDRWFYSKDSEQIFFGHGNIIDSLTRGLALFYTEDEPYIGYACDTSGHKHYRFDYNEKGYLKTVENLHHKSPIYLANTAPLSYGSLKKPYDFLKVFESERETMIWEDQDKNPKLIEMPRMNLSFAAVDSNEKGSRWECQEIKGFFLSEKQFVEPLAKLNVKGFLRLENDKGEVKILIPRRNLQNDNRALASERKFDLKEKETKQDYLVFDYKSLKGRKERELQMGPEEGFYMAFLALSAATEEGYQLARHLLDPNKLRIGKVREEEIELLNWTVRLAEKNGDHDPRAIALRLHALYLLQEQIERGQAQESIKSTLTHDGKFWESVHKDLIQYVETLQHSTGYHLPVHELSKLCKLVMGNKSLGPSIVHFLEQLGPKTTGEWTLDLTKARAKPSSSEPRLKALKEFRGKEYSFGREIKKAKEKIQKALSSGRPSELREISEPFIVRAKDPCIFFIRKLPIAISGTKEQKQELRDSLRLKTGDEKAIVHTTILQVLLDHPGKFSIPTDLNSEWEDEAENYIAPIIDFAIDRLEENGIVEVIEPIKLPSKDNTLRPKQIPRPIEISKIPDLLFGDARPLRSLEDVKEINFSDTFEKVDEKTVQEKNAKEQQKLKIVHGEIQELLNIPTGKVGEKVIGRLQKGCIIYMDNVSKPKEEYRVKENTIVKFHDDLGLMIEYRLGALAKQASRICLMAEMNTGLIDNKLLMALQSVSGKIEKLTIDDLCLLYAKGGLRGELANEIEQYLLEATYTQQLERSMERVADYIKAKGEDKKSAEIALIEEVFKKRIYDPKIHPECLVLEYTANILINQKQYDSFMLLLEKGTVEQPIVQMIMGSGKTSVLMKLLGLLRADGKRLSVLVLTDELLESMSEEVRTGFVRTFNMLLVPFEVNRNTDLSVEKLQEMHEKLERCRLGQGALITSPKSMHSFYLNFLETVIKSHSAQGNVKAELIKKIGFQRAILRLFATYGSALLDEVDILFNCRTEVNFPFGKEVSMPEEEQDLLLDLYDTLIDNPKIAEILKYDFFPSASQPGSTLYMEDTFRDKIRPLIIEAFFDSLSAEEAPDHLQFLDKLKEEEKDILRDYLFQVKDTARRKTADLFVESLKNEKAKNVLALLKEELNTLFPLTLQKNCGEHYNYSLLYSFLSYAIPFNNGRALEGSRFSNAHETSNYTIQTALKYGLREEAIISRLTTLQKQCLEDLQNGKKINDIDANKAFIKLADGDKKYFLPKLTEEDKIEIAKAINDNKKRQRDFLKSNVLPSIRFHTKKLNSNAQMLARFFHDVIGFSGTLSNADTFPNTVTPIPEYDVDAQTLFLLIGHLITTDEENNINKMNNVSPPIPVADGKSVLEEAKRLISQGINVLSIADGGGYLNEEDPDTFAAKLSQELHSVNPEIQAAAYHNKNSELVVKEHDKTEIMTFSNCPISKENRATVYFEPFTTGTDIKQAPNAVQVQTFSRKTTFREMAQTAWRMREPHRGHRYIFIVSEDVAQVIKKKLELPHDTELTLIHLFRFAWLNEIEQLSDDLVLAGKLEIINMIQWEIVKILLDFDISDQEVSDLFVEELEAIFSPKQPVTAYEMYGKSSEEKPTLEILMQEINDSLAMLENAQKKAIILKERINNKLLRNTLEGQIEKKLLPETAMAPISSSHDQQVQVQQQQRTRQQQRQQVQQQEITVDGRDKTKWQSIAWPDVEPEKIFDAAFYEQTWRASAYKKASHGVAMTPSWIPDMTYPLLGALVETMPSTMMVAALSVAAYDVSKDLGLVKPGLDIVNNIYGSHIKWMKDKWFSFQAEVKGAPLPYSLSAYLEESDQGSLAKMIDPGLVVTHNFAPREAFNAEMKVPRPFQPDSKDVREVLLMQNKQDQNWQLVLIDKEEAKYFRNLLAQDKEENKKVKRELRICLYHPITGMVQQGAEAISENEIQNDPQVLRLIAQAKFYNGESSYSPAEQRELIKWINENDPEQLKQIFIDQILAQSPDAAERWERLTKV